MAAAPAPSSLAAVFLDVFLVVALATSSAADDDSGMTHLHLFMHDTATGSNPTAVRVIKGPGGAVVPGLAFGDTTVIDDALTESSSPSSAAVGRAQGYYMMSSQSGPPVLAVCANLLLTAGEHNGSTVAVMGRDDIGADVRELAVVGGTGSFRMATGYVLWKTATMNGPDAIVELDVYVRTSTSSTGGGGAGGSLSSGVAGVRRRVNACVVAVVVAVVVGSCVW